MSSLHTISQCTSNNCPMKKSTRSFFQPYLQVEDTPYVLTIINFAAKYRNHSYSIGVKTRYVCIQILVFLCIWEVWISSVKYGKSRQEYKLFTNSKARSIIRRLGDTLLLMQTTTLQGFIFFFIYSFSCQISITIHMSNSMHLCPDWVS